MKSYYVTCPTCGAHLDPGERCEDCLGEVVIVWASDRATSRTPSD